jgi:FkbM family methyltransferase
MFWRNFKTLSQFSFGELVWLVPSLILQRLRERMPQAHLDKKMLFDDFLLKGNELRKDGPANILTINDDPALGQYSVALRRHSSDFHVFTQVLRDKEYQELVNLVGHYQPKESIRYIVDAGANIGLTTLFFKKYFPDALTVSIEPDAENFKLLQQNVRLNGLLNVCPLRAALWKSNENLEIDSSFRDGLEWSRSVKPAQALQRQVVPGKTVQDIMAQFAMPHLDILKIDIEGAEQYVFEEAQQVRQFLSKTKFIAIEIHDEYAVRPLIMAQLTEAGFACSAAAEFVIGMNRTLVK